MLYSITRNRVLLPALMFLCGAIVFLSNAFGELISVLVIGLLSFITVFYVSYKYPRYNVLFLLGAAFFVPLLIKAFYLYGLPVNMATELLCFLITLTLFLNGRFAGAKTLPGILLLLWAFFLLVEVLNPNASSRVASFLAIRGLIPMILVFFIMYSSVSTKRDVYIFFGGWFALSGCAALYGLYQEFFGLPSHDMAWATYDEVLYGILFTWGRMRKFSFFFSPSEFGMLMALAGSAALVVAFFARKQSLRIMAVFACLVCIWAMMYTGSRTSMVLLPVGIGMFALITLNRKVLVAVGVIMVAGLVMFMRPSSNRVLFVMSTAFQGEDDPSMNVRLQNQERIRSFIISNPIGFGLGSTGYLGAKYSPNTFIGTFPPDSEFVKIAIETGWIGLFLWCAILAILFGYGVNALFKTRDPEWRTLLTVALVIFFMLIVGQYPQEIFFASQALSIIFSAMIGLFAKINYIQERGVAESYKDQ